MTTPTLTHEQAEQLRMASTGALFFTDIHAGRILSWARKDGLAGFSDLPDGSMRWALTDAGRETLAKYDAEWVTVRREHLEELRDAAQLAVDELFEVLTAYGDPGQLSAMAPTEQAIAHANEVLEGK